jgi:class 3 adenylate cyclase
VSRKCRRHPVKHTGDGVCAVFESATRAAAAALQAQSELELRVRIGLHTGEAEERGGDFFGTTLNRCARIMDAGHGGQILVSAVTRALLDAAECVDLGEWVLKGFAEPERIFQVGTGKFPPRCERLSGAPLSSHGCEGGSP